MKSLFLLLENDPFDPGSIWQDKIDPNWKIEIVGPSPMGGSRKEWEIKYPGSDRTTTLLEITIKDFYKPVS